MPTFVSNQSGDVSLKVKRQKGKFQYQAILKNGGCPFEGHGTSDDSEEEAIRNAILALEKKLLGLYKGSSTLEQDFTSAVADVSRQSGIEIVLSN